MADPLLDAAHRGTPPQGGGEPSEERLPSRAEVHANPQAYGIPPGGNPDDWFNEYVAHTLAYMDPAELDINALDPNAPDYQQRLAVIQRHRRLMEDWGYNPDSLSFLNDSRPGDRQTGLQAVRIDPSDPESGIGSIVGFRGTEPFAGHQSNLSNPTGAFDDVAADLGRHVGSNQYQANQERINEFIAAGVGPMTLTGHSLGGALAQHAAAGTNSPNIANVVGFQAPGIDSGSAQAFNQRNAGGATNVRFHEHQNDIVHRAGEQKLAGTHYTWNDTNNPWFGPAHTSYFMYNGMGGNGQQVTNVGAGSAATATNHDPVAGNRLGLEGGRQLIGGPVNIAAAPVQGGFAALEGLGTAANNAGTGLWNSGSDFVGGISNAGTSVGTGLSEGASQVWNGDVLEGMGTMAGGVGQGVLDVAGGVWNGATGLVRTAGGLVVDTGKAAWDGVSTAGSNLIDGVATTARGIGNVAAWGYNKIAGLFSSDDEEQIQPQQQQQQAPQQQQQQ